MTSKMIFLNICVAVVVFSLFLLVFLKPKSGPQFEIIKNEAKKEAKVTPKVTEKAKSVVTPSPASKK